MFIALPRLWCHLAIDLKSGFGDTQAPTKMFLCKISTRRSYHALILSQQSLFLSVCAGTNNWFRAPEGKGGMFDFFQWVRCSHVGPGLLSPHTHSFQEGWFCTVGIDGVSRSHVIWRRFLWLAQSSSSCTNRGGLLVTSMCTMASVRQVSKPERQIYLTAKPLRWTFPCGETGTIQTSNSGTCSGAFASIPRV